MRILVLSVPVGSGHIKAAGAVEQALTRLTPKAQIRSENCFQWVYPLYGYAYTSVYKFAQKRARRLLKFFYGGFGVDSGSSELLYKFHQATADRFKNLLEEFKPEYILCTHFSPGYFSALYKERYRYKLGIVITDYYIHPHWVNKEIDHYFIPHESLIDQLLSYGPSRNQIYPFGIPVGQELETEIDKDKARKSFGLEKNRICAVVMGSRVFGGEWFSLVQKIVDFDYDLLVLCGENSSARKKIERLRGRANLKTYGMIKNIYDLLSICDILITKAGGITTTEATKVGPCLLFANSIVGLEDKNEDFFIRHNAARRLNNKNAKSTLSDLLNSPEKMSEMRKNLRNLAKKNSAQNIANVIFKSLNGQRGI